MLLHLGPCLYLQHICVPLHLCFCVFIPVHVETSDAGNAVGPHPVHNEDLADAEFLLELLGSDGHRVEETEAPVDKQTGRVAATCLYHDIFTKLISQNHHMDLRNL